MCVTKHKDIIALTKYVIDQQDIEILIKESYTQNTTKFGSLRSLIYEMLKFLLFWSGMD